MRRKFLASILALCMVMSLLPMAAFAAAPTDAKEIKTEGTWSEKVYSVTLGDQDTDAKTELEKSTSSGSLALQDSKGDAISNDSVTVKYENNALSLTFTTEPTVSTVYYVEVTDSSSNKTYVKVTVAPKSSDATLSALTVNDNVTLTPAFNSNTTAYTASVENTVASVTVTPTVTDENATVKVNNTDVASGSASEAINLTVGSNAIKVLVTAEDGTTTKEYTITITRADEETSDKDTLTAEDFTYTAPASPTYDGTAKAATVTAKDGVTTGAITVKYYSGSAPTGSDTAPTNAGTYTVKIDVTASNDYEAITALEVGTFTIAPKELSIKSEGTSVTAKTYDGTTDATVTVVFEGLVGGDTLTANSDYTVTANFADANAGTDKAVVGTVKLADSVKNYTLTDGALSGLKGNINQVATLELTATKLVSTAENAAAPAPIALSSMTGYPASPKEFGGTPTFALTANALDSAKGVANASVADAALTLTLKEDLTSINENDEDVFALTSTNATNYGTITINVTVTYTTKPVLTISGATAAPDLKYTGEAQKGYTGTPTVSTNDFNVTNDDIIATYVGIDETSYTSSTTPPTDAGKYKVTLDVPASVDQYKSEPLVLNFTIAPAIPTFTAPTCSALTEEALLSTSTLTGGEVKGVDGTAIEGTFAWSDGTVTVAQGTAYTWIFTPTTANANYDFSTVTGELTPWASSGGNQGGNNGSGNGSTTPTPPPEEPDPNPPSTGEDVTQTVTPDISEGTASATVDKETADKLVSDAVDNKSENVTVKVDVPADADVNEVKADIPASAVADLASKTDAALTVDTPVGNVTIPNKTLAQLGGTSGNVTVTAAVNEDNSVKVEVQANGSTVGALNGGMKVDLPVSQPTAGTVAVLVDAEGNETILPKSAVDGSEVAVLLENGSATIKFVDNAQSFADTDNHWAKNSIAFVSSRNLFQGMENSSFKADVPMNRAMLVTVLHRLESTPAASGSSFDDVPSDSYYATAAAWAAGKGIVTGDDSGFSGDRSVTREEMAVMLYRYVQTINGNKGTLGSYSGMGGANDVSGWASEAMRWAVGSGIIGGDNSGNLNPGSTATRGEVSQMLMNFVKLITK